ncbi:MAG: TIM barrel protein [Candidatus Sulfopaludibacter sp.]|nr:TIM barrel protein [Candidatus Sulfopaludibacter sp.]
MGASTESFHDFPRIPGRDNVEEIIGGLKASGVGEIDLASVNTEAPNPDAGLPPPPPPGPYGGPPAGFTPAELAARARALRDNLRKWRVATPASHYRNLRTRFAGAGIAVYAMSFQHDDAFTDDELEATFGHAKALGVEVISSRATLPMARRLAPFAEKHAIPVAFRNERETAAQLSALAAVSPRFRVNLDIGNFTAANQEAVAYIQENHQKITHVMVKDRTRNEGGNEVFGSGDTPIQAVCALLRDKQYPIRAFVDYEYVGLGTPQEEVRKCVAYVKAALA